MVWGRDNNGNDAGKRGDERAPGVSASSGADLDAGSSGVELTARGTSSGLVLRASGAVKQDQLWSALRAFIQSRQSFVEGNQVAIEWVDQEPTIDVVEFIRARVLSDFDIDLVVRGLVSRRGGDAITDEPREIPGVFSGVHGIEESDSKGAQVTRIFPIDRSSQHISDDDGSKRGGRSSSESGIRGDHSRQPPTGMGRGGLGNQVESSIYGSSIYKDEQAAAGMTRIKADSVVSHERSLFGGLEDTARAVSSGRSGGFMDEEEGFGSGSMGSTGPDGAGYANAGRSSSINPSSGGSSSLGSSALGSSAMRSSGAKLGATPKVGWGAAIANWDDADARFVYGTLRSGQKIETEHSVLVFGDVNSGAEIVAGGDVVVLGSLRGVAHAGAYDETGGGRVIFALALEPTQLRIGAVISRGVVGSSSTAAATATSSSSPEIARVEGQSIVVESYQARGAPIARGARGSARGGRG